MEKRPPHCKLTVVKALVAEGKVGVTNVARQGAAARTFRRARGSGGAKLSGFLQKHDDEGR